MIHGKFHHAIESISLGYNNLLLGQYLQQSMQLTCFAERSKGKVAFTSNQSSNILHTYSRGRYGEACPWINKEDLLTLQQMKTRKLKVSTCVEVITCKFTPVIHIHDRNKRRIKFLSHIQRLSAFKNENKGQYKQNWMHLPLCKSNNYKRRFVLN